MPTNTRLTAAAIALTSTLALMTSGTVAILDRGAGATALDPTQHAVTVLRAAIKTDWLSPADARRSLEARGAVLADWLHTRGGSVRVISSSGSLRTHDANGLRLRTPKARFERILEIQVPQEIEFAHVERALLGPDGSVVIASADGSGQGDPPRGGSAEFEF